MPRPTPAVSADPRRSGVRDVARAAGVSVATVSRALNTPEKVLPELRHRVVAAAAKLSYVPHAGARALSSAKAWRIGALIPTIDNSIFSAVVTSMQRQFASAGYALVISVTEELPLQRFLTYRLSVLTKLNRQASAILAKAGGLKLTEWRVVALLALNGEMSGVRSAEIAGIDPGLLSRTLFALEERQLVKSTRSSTDRRAVLVALTRQGRSAVWCSNRSSSA